MNQFFEGLANQNNANVSSTDIKDNFNLRAGGTMKIVKGIITLEISYWADVYKSNYPGYVSVDDLDYDEVCTYINGIKIDSVSKFNEGLANMGLSSISKTLEITSSEIKNEIYKAVNNSKAFKVVFQDCELFDLLNAEQQRQVVVDYAIGNYDNTGAWTLHKYGLIESQKEKPTFEQFMENLKNK